MTIPIEYIHIQQLKIAHAVIGEGKPLLLLHGWGANIELVWQLATAMSPLGYRVYAVDLPGFGKSDEPKRAWTVFDYAQFVLDYLDHAEIAKTYLFGHSFGGRLSLILGAEQPNRILKIALADSAGIRPTLPLSVQWRTATYKQVRRTLEAIGLKNLSNRLREQYNARYGSSDFNAISGIMRQTFIQVINQDLLDHAKRVKPSTLLFWGGKDTDTPLWMGQLLEKTIPDAGLVVYPDAGHYSYLEHLHDTARTMDYFFSH